MTNRKSLTIISFILISTLNVNITKGNTSSLAVSGYVDYSYISRLSDGSLIRLPYRISSINFENRMKNISLNGNLSIEYHIKDDTYFLGSSNPQDFILDLRELYLTYSGNKYDFRIGKQIHSWGNVDENSPTDNASGLDYYYLFFGGIDRKMASLSIALDYYIGDLKINSVFSPIHSTNRIPLGNDDFPVELPVYPDPSEILPISGKPFEGGIRGIYSAGFGNISASYFTGYDRTFNLTGVNVYGRGSDLSNPFVDIVYGYRKTNVLGMGIVLLNNWVTIRSDVGLFLTKDKNKNIARQSSRSTLYSFYLTDSLHLSYPLIEKSQYVQATFQIETELPFGLNIIAQYFVHDRLDYSSDSLPIDQEISIPNLEIDPENLNPANFFTPGMGVPIAILTDKAIFLKLNKNILDNQLELGLTSMLDMSNSSNSHLANGSLTELTAIFSFNQNTNIALALTKIIGNEHHPDRNDYPFNKMEDFSHFRFELKYFF